MNAALRVIDESMITPPAPYDADLLCRTILSGALALPPSLDDRVSFTADTHVLLRHAAAQAYLQLPLALRQFLALRGVSFKLGSYYDGVALRGPQLALSPDRRDNVRKHRNQSPGVYDKKSKIAYAFEYVLSRDAVPIIGQKPDAAAVAAGLWHRHGPRAIARITRHEIWHAVDYNAGLPSRWPAFRRAYEEDIAALGGKKAARDADLGYFIQDDIPHRGASEAFAEIGAELNGGGVRGKRITKKFSACTGFILDLQREVTAASQQGMQEMVDFLLACKNSGKIWSYKNDDWRSLFTPSSARVSHQPVG